jgi:tRNA-dihydrouridine synthase
MDRLIPVFNRYPLARVIIHPRTGVQMYGGQVDLNGFATCLARIVHPVVFNGDINDTRTFQSLESRFPQVCGWMVGRGMIANPFLAESIRGEIGSAGNRNARFAAFHDELVEAYCRRFSGSGHVLDRMKGYWCYLADGFDDGRRLLKRIRKTNSLERYREFVAAALESLNRWDSRSGMAE